MRIKSTLIVLFLTFFISITVFSRGAITSIFNLPTHQTVGPDILFLDVGHRYFDVNQNSTNINITLGYGILKNLDIYGGFSFRNQEGILSSKLNILSDYNTNKDPVSIALYGGFGHKDATAFSNALSLSFKDYDNQQAKKKFGTSDRTSAFAQLIVEKHFFKDILTVGIVPTYGQNTNFYFKSKSDYSFGTGVYTGLFFADKIAVCGEVVPNFVGFANKYMNYNAGFKYVGFRHTISLWVGNSWGYSPVEYMVGSLDLRPKFGFTFTREFDLW